MTTAAPTPAERLNQAQVQIDQLNVLLEKMWVERHMLASAIHELKLVRRHVELALAGIDQGS